MDRRHFVQNLVGVVLASCFGFLGLLSARVAPRTRKVTIFYHKNQSLNQWLAENNKLLNVPEWHAYLKELQANGALKKISRLAYKDRIVFEFKFRSHQDLADFNSNARRRGGLDIQKMRMLGYSDKIELV